MDHGVMKKFVLDWKIMKTWPWFLWVLLAIIVAGALGIIASLFYFYIKFRIWVYYISWLVLVVLYFIIRGIKKAHLHHYVICMIFITLIGYQSVWLTIVHGIANGIMIEGSARWGLDPIWSGSKFSEVLHEGDFEKKKGSGSY